MQIGYRCSFAREGFEAGETNALHNMVEEVDNKLRKNNLRLKGLKESVEGDNLKTYLGHY